MLKFFTCCPHSIQLIFIFQFSVEIPCHTNLGRHSNQSSLSINHRQKSCSTQNLNTKDPTADRSIGSSTGKRIYVKNNTKNKIPSSTFDNLNVVVTIDIGSSYSGFAYYVNDSVPENIRIMQKYKGIIYWCTRSYPTCRNQSKLVYQLTICFIDHHMMKIPSVLLLNTKTEFHSFGHEAKNHFLHVEENSAYLSSHWLLFEKFKLQLINSYVSFSIVYILGIYYVYCLRPFRVRRIFTLE